MINKFTDDEGNIANFFFSELFNARERSLFFPRPTRVKKVKLLVGSVFWEKLIDGKSFRWLWDA